jgi:hypothetical protein
MKTTLLALMLSSASLLAVKTPAENGAGAGEASEGAPQAVVDDAGKQLFGKMLGYWVVDFESAVTRKGLAGKDVGAAEEKQMAALTMEITETVMSNYLPEPAAPGPTKVILLSQDLAKRSITLRDPDFEDEPYELATLVLSADGDHLTIGDVDFKRISKEAFTARVPHAVDDAGRQLFAKMLGYWVFDMDSAVNKKAIQDGAPSEDDKKEMETFTMEISASAITQYSLDGPVPEEIALWSQDLAARSVTIEDMVVSLSENAERLTVKEAADASGTEFKRITKEAFEKRVPEDRRKAPLAR